MRRLLAEIAVCAVVISGSQAAEYPVTDTSVKNIPNMAKPL